MNTTDTTATAIPHIDTPIAELFDQLEIFQSVGQAIAWTNQYGNTALTAQVTETIRRLLGASSEERRNRGLQLLERQIRAQAAWVQLFDLIVPCGGYEKLKKLVSTMRDEALDGEEYEAAKQAVLGAQIEYTERQRQSEEAIAVILDLANEEAFAFSVRADLRAWQVDTLDAVLQGKGLRQHPNSLRVTAERLEFLSKRFFGEMTTSNGGSSGRQAQIRAKKAARSARDRAERDKRKGGGQHKKG